MRPGTEGYAEAAARLLRTRLPFEDVHAPILHLIPRAPSRVLDIGSGPGHDAARLAAMGHSVVAAEPTPAWLRGASDLHGKNGIRWVEDGLPELGAVRSLGLRYALVLMTGVWMHLDEEERRDAMPRVASLIEPAGTLALSLRHGPVPAGRRMFEVGGAETVELARRCGLHLLVEVKGRESIQPANRAAGVTWTVLAFTRPA